MPTFVEVRDGRDVRYINLDQIMSVEKMHDGYTLYDPDKDYEYIIYWTSGCMEDEGEPITEKMAQQIIGFIRSTGYLLEDKGY